MAFGVTSCSKQIHDAFVTDDRSKTFFHGHSYTANPIACTAALASLDLFDLPQTQKNIDRIGKQHAEFVRKIKNHPQIVHVRQKGTIVAIELKTAEDSSYFNSLRDKIYDFFIKKGVILRPLGNIIYILPPYCISNKDLKYIYESIINFLDTNFEK